MATGFPEGIWVWICISIIILLYLILWGVLQPGAGEFKRKAGEYLKNKKRSD